MERLCTEKVEKYYYYYYYRQICTDAALRQTRNMEHGVQGKGKGKKFKLNINDKRVEVRTKLLTLGPLDKGKLGIRN